MKYLAGTVLSQGWNLHLLQKIFFQDHFGVVSFDLKKKPTHFEEKQRCKDDHVLLDYNVEGVTAPDFDELVKAVIFKQGIYPGDVEDYCGLDNGQGFTEMGFIVRHKVSLRLILRMKYCSKKSSRKPVKRNLFLSCCIQLP